MAIQLEGRPPSRVIRLIDDISVGPYLAHSVAATLAVVVLPMAAAFALTYGGRPPPAGWLVAAASITLAVAGSLLGARLWDQVPDSDGIEFGELMLWSWLQRNSAERRIKLHKVELGLEPSGETTKENIPRARRLELLRDLTASLQVKDAYTRGHSRRVERLVYRCAMAMDLNVHDTQQARVAASVHDIGKLYVPDEILRKPGSLTRLEFETVKEHAARGGRMVEALGDPALVAAVRHHHERWDGHGYPDGLVAHEIPQAARLIAVADTYDALTSTRTYRGKKSHRKAIRILDAEKGKQLDPQVVEAFVECAHERAGAYLLGLAAFAPVGDAIAQAASWFRKRSSALAAGAMALVAALLAGAVVSEPAVTPASQIAAPSEPAEVVEPAAEHKEEVARPNGAPAAEDTAPVAAPPEGTTDDVVLGTRVEAPTRRQPSNDDVRVVRRPARPRAQEPDVEPQAAVDRVIWPPGHSTKGSTWPPGHVGKGDQWPPGHARRSGATEESRACADNPGRGLGRGRTKHC